MVSDAIIRLIPGALGNDMGSVDESFSTSDDGGLLEYAQYTRPANFNGSSVPDVLLSGDHAKVAAWRRRNAIERTCRWRPDLIDSARLTDGERRRALDPRPGAVGTPSSAPAVGAPISSTPRA